MNLLEILKKNADNAKSYIDGLVSKKQDTLTFDTAPTKGSQNPVTSDGIQKAIAAKTVDLSNYPTKDGIGATGNWSINAATATTANTATNASHATNADKATTATTANIAKACSGNAATASKLSTARKINITGNASGSAAFDGSGDINISTTVNESKHASAADTATNDSNGANIASTYVKKAGDTTTGKITFAATDLNALPEVKKTSDDNMSGVRFSSKTKFLGAVGKRLSNGDDLLNLRSDNSRVDVVLDSRNYNNYAPTKTGGGASGTWGINISGTATKATQDAFGNVIADTYATKAALLAKQEKLTFDTTPTKGSTNPVTSDGIKKAIDAKTIDLSNYYTKAQVDSAISTAISAIVDGNNKSY